MATFSGLQGRLRARLGHLPKQTRTIILTVVYGAGAGLVTVAFQVTLTVLYNAGLLQTFHLSRGVFLLSSFGLMVGGALVSGWLLARFAPEAVGSGIPQLKAAFWKDFGFMGWRIIWVKFLAGALQIGTGSSLGREGPSVQLAGALGSNLAGMVGEPKQRRRRGAATGAAAGLAAAFNTPLAAVTFVLEELIGDLNSRFLGGILLAAMMGALVVHGILGPQPSFTLEPVGEPTWHVYLLVPVVAALAALAGVLFQEGTLQLRSLSKQWYLLPPWLHPAVGATIAWGLGAAVFLSTGRQGVFGLGYGDLSAALAGKLAWPIAGVLLATKLAATVACYGTGGCGGIFSPTLFFGAMTGLAVAGLVQTVMPMPADVVAILAIVGMSATLGAVVRAPVTSILIVFEMTHQFALVPPLMLGALISQAISRRLLRANFYDAILDQDGHDLERFTPPRDLRAWQEQPVMHLANPRPVIASSLEPDAIKRLLLAHPYGRFPVVIRSELQGILERSAASFALSQGAPPKLAPAVTCHPEERVQDVEERLITTSAGILVLQRAPGGTIDGLLTLHDLLRAQIAASERSDEGAT